MAGLGQVLMGRGYSQHAPYTHGRGPTRPNWGGGEPLFGYSCDFDHLRRRRVSCVPLGRGKRRKPLAWWVRRLRL